MPALDESASAIVEMLSRLDTRLSAMEAKVDAILAVMARPEPGVAEQAGATTLYDRRKGKAAFDGADRRMGEI
jgi:hypothetical protein